MASRFSVPSSAVKSEGRFYRAVDRASADIAHFRDDLSRQSQEFEALLQYYQDNRGSIHFAPGGTRREPRTNLGTQDESWFYLDGRGNKVWVQNMALDTTDPRSGTWVGNEHRDGRYVVVRVPAQKRCGSLQADYARRCAEFDHARTATRPASRGQHAAPAPAGDVGAYVAAQKVLSNELERARVPDTTYVFRRPTTIEEAEQRLQELRAEEARLTGQHHYPLPSGAGYQPYPANSV